MDDAALEQGVQAATPGRCRQRAHAARPLEPDRWIPAYAPAPRRHLDDLPLVVREINVDGPLVLRDSEVHLLLGASMAGACLDRRESIHASLTGGRALMRGEKLPHEPPA